jgi:hypothetical protein
MWNPEARDSSPFIFTFMSSWERPKMPPLPGRRGTRRSLWKRAAAGLDELELEPWVSLWSEESTPSPTTRLDGGEQDAAAALPGRRGTRRSLEKIAATGLDEVGGSSCGKITSVRMPLLPHLFA